MENQSKIQKLNKQLKDAQNDMESEQVNRVLEQQEKMLDTLSKEYQQLIESVSKDRDTLLKEGNQLISANGAEIQQTINETASEYGMQLTDNMQSATANITTGLSGIKTVLDTIAQHVAGRIVDTDGETHDVNAGGAKTDAISKLLSSGTNTKPSSKLTKAIGEAYGVGLNLQQIADLSRLLGLNYELKDFTNESPIHNQAKLDILNELEERKYLKKSGNSYIRGYAGGGVISSVANAIRLNGDKVLISGKPGERMLTEKQNENFEKFTDALPDLVNLTDIIKPNVNVPTAIDRNIGGVTYGGNNQITIELPNVTNYEDFMRKFQNDPKAEQLVQHMTASALNGSRLGKNTIRF